MRELQIEQMSKDRQAPCIKVCSDSPRSAVPHSRQLETAASGAAGGCLPRRQRGHSGGGAGQRLRCMIQTSQDRAPTVLPEHLPRERIVFHRPSAGPLRGGALPQAGRGT